MLRMIKRSAEYNCTVQIEGPAGVIEIRDLTWMPEDRSDLVEICYWAAWAVLEGAYHCCFSLPGKVSLLPPHEPTD